MRAPLICRAVSPACASRLTSVVVSQQSLTERDRAAAYFLIRSLASRI